VIGQLEVPAASLPEEEYTLRFGRGNDRMFSYVAAFRPVVGPTGVKRLCWKCDHYLHVLPRTKIREPTFPLSDYVFMAWWSIGGSKIWFACHVEDNMSALAEIRSLIL